MSNIDSVHQPQQAPSAQNFYVVPVFVCSPPSPGTSSVSGGSLCQALPASPASQPGADPQDITVHFDKTRMCRYFPNCYKGEACTFAHTSRELRIRPNLMKTRLCAGYRSGRCALRASECRFAHGLEELRDWPDRNGAGPCASLPQAAPVPMLGGLVASGSACAGWSGTNFANHSRIAAESLGSFVEWVPPGGFQPMPVLAPAPSPVLAPAPSPMAEPAATSEAAPAPTPAAALVPAPSPTAWVQRPLPVPLDTLDVLSQWQQGLSQFYAPGQDHPLTPEQCKSALSEIAPEVYED